MTPPPTFFTFYSFKGGVGRTQTLANAAVALANLGRSVVVIDFDLESPGLHRYFARVSTPFTPLSDEDLNQQKGLLDWLELAQSLPEEEPQLHEYLLDVTCSAHRTEAGGRLRLLACGAWAPPDRPSYSQRVLGFDWGTFLDEGYGTQFLELLRRQLEVEGAEVVLIDSRTGLTDAGLVCTFLLPDYVVILFALHEQGIQGAGRMARQLRHRRKAVLEQYSDVPEEERPRVPREVILLPSRVDEDQQLDARDRWIERARAELSNLGVWLGEHRQRLPYLAKASFGENILVDPSQEPTDLSEVLKSLAHRLNALHQGEIWTEERLQGPTLAPTFQELRFRCEALVTEIERFLSGLEEAESLLRDASSLHALETRLSHLWKLQGMLNEQAVELVRALGEFSSRCGILAQAFPDRPDNKEQWHALREALLASVSTLENRAEEKWKGVKDALKTSAEVEDSEFANILNQLRPLLEQGDWNVLTDEAARQTRRLAESSLEGLLRRNSLELERLKRRWPEPGEQLEWVNQQLTQLLERQSGDPEEQRLPLRNLIRLWLPLEEGARPPRLIWDAWDTLCLFTADDATDSEEIFGESGKVLWQRACRCLLQDLEQDESVAPLQVGLEARKQLESMIDRADALVEPLVTKLSEGLLGLLERTKRFTQQLPHLQSRRRDLLLELALQSLCRPGEVLKDEPPWRVPLLANMLLEFPRDPELCVSWLQSLVLRKDVREAFFSLVALLSERVSLTVDSPAVRDIPVRYALTSLDSNPDHHGAVDALLRNPGMRAMLEWSPAGRALLTRYDHGLLNGSSPSDELLGKVEALEQLHARCQEALEPSVPAKWPHARDFGKMFKEYFEAILNNIWTRMLETASAKKTLSTFNVDSWIEITLKQLKKGKKPIHAPDELEKRGLARSADTIVKLLIELNAAQESLPKSAKQHVDDTRAERIKLQKLFEPFYTDPKMAPELCLRLTGFEHRPNPSIVSSPAQTDGAATPRATFQVPSNLPPLTLRQSSVPIMLLDMEEGEAPECFVRFHRHLLEYYAGQRSWDTVGVRLVTQDAIASASALILESQGHAPETHRLLRDRWMALLQQARSSAEEALRGQEELKKRGLQPEDHQDLDEWLAQLNSELSRLPTGLELELPERIKKLGTDPLGDLRVYQDAVRDELTACKVKLEQRQEQTKKQVLKLKRDINEAADKLEMDTELDEAQLEAIQRLRQRASEGLRQRDLSVLEAVKEALGNASEHPKHLLALPAHLEPVRPAWSATVEGPVRESAAEPGSEDRIETRQDMDRRRSLTAEQVQQVWDELSERVKRELESTPLDKQESSPAFEPERTEPYRLTDPELRKSSRVAATRLRQKPEGLEPLAVWLTCLSFQQLQDNKLERLLERVIEACTLLELPGLRLAYLDRWRLMGWNLLLSILHRLYSGETHPALEADQLSSQRLDRGLELLDLHELAAELAVPLLESGLQLEHDPLLERCLPWFSRHPMACQEVIDCLCDEATLYARAYLLKQGSEEARRRARAPLVALRIGLSLFGKLERISSATSASLRRSLTAAERELFLHGSPEQGQRVLLDLLIHARQVLEQDVTSEVGQSFAAALAKTADGIKHLRQDVPKLSHRLLTRSWGTGGSDAPYLVLEVHYHSGFGPLRELITEAVLLDATQSPIRDGVASLPPLPRLAVGSVVEMRLPINQANTRVREAATIRIQQRYRGWEFITQSLEIKTALFPLEVKPSAEPGSRQPTPSPSNPFVAGSPIKPFEMIFGRDEQVEQIRQALMGAHQDQVVMVLGERRAGKTTLLNKFKEHPLIKGRYWALDIDLQHLSEKERPAAFFRDRFVLPCSRLLEHQGLSRDKLPLLDFEQNPIIVFRQWMGEVDQLLKRRDRRLLLVIDEVERLFEVIERNEKRSEGSGGLSRETVAGLRDVFQKMERVSFVLAGVTPILRRFISQPGERLFKLALEVECKPLDPDSAKRLIREPAMEHYEVQPSGVDLIVRETGRQPYLIQFVCSHLFSYMTRNGLKTATRTHIEHVLKEQVIPHRRPFTYLSEDVKDPIDFQIIQSLAMLQRTNVAVKSNDITALLLRIGRKFSQDEVQSRLKRLEMEAPQVLERRVATSDAFRLTVGLFVRHLRALIRAEGGW